jgi:hypothetical protein
MKRTLCKCCGYPVVEMNPIEAALTPLQLRVFNVVRRAGSAGISSRDALDIVYADDIKMPPDDTNIISVVACQANRRLAPFGLKIKAARGPGAKLTIQLLEQVAA